jgi:hypothetical protein
MSTMSTTPCTCAGHHGTKPAANERPRYYARQLVTPDDMTLEQDYFRARMRRHNRFMHGWGVVCGARVVPADKPWKVIVKNGYILGPYGDEIYIEKDQCVDVRDACTPAPPVDDGCHEAQPAPPSNAKQYVAVQYKEMQSRLIRVPAGGCGCEDSICEYSRICDSYQICILDHCPNTGTPPREPVFSGPAPECPPCPEEPWVALASFTVDENGAVTVQECDCRRQAIGFGTFWWQCSAAGGTDNKGTPGPNRPQPTQPGQPARPTPIAPAPQPARPAQPSSKKSDKP